MIDNRFLAKSLGLLNPPQPVLAHAEDSLEKVISILQEHKNGSVLIVSAEGHLIGIFTERDVVLKIVNKGINIDTTPVSDYMTKEPATATMTTTIAYALNMMSHGGFRNIPIVDENRIPVGLVAVKNILDYLAQSIGRVD